MTEKLLNKIMVVEDETDILTIIKFSLARLAEFKVIYCHSGKEALEQVADFSPDLILMDMMMPEMDGLTLLKTLRQNTEFSKIPVIFMTARAQPEEVKNYLKSGAIGVITKPFDPLALPDTLKTIWKENMGKNNG